MKEPKPCPFCSERDPLPVVVVHDNFAAVECTCGARGPVFGDEETPLEQRKRLAVIAWNGVRR